MRNNEVFKAPYSTINLVSLIDKETLKKIGEDAVRHFDNDVLSYSGWNKKRKKWLEHFMNVVEEGKNYPDSHASNVAVPIVPTACIQFSARAYEALLPAKNKVKILRTGIEDMFRADRIEKHMNWQLDYEMEEFEESFDITLLQLPINGSAFRKTYYDNVLGRNRSINCPVEDIVVPYGCSPIEVPNRITHVIRMSKEDILMRSKLKTAYKKQSGDTIAIGLFEHVEGLDTDTLDLSKTPGQIADPTIDTSVRDESDKIEGVQQPINQEYIPRVLLEQHVSLDLNEDGIPEQYILTVDKVTKRVLRITKRNYIDAENTTLTVDHFTHYYFFPNPEGYYGLGFGHILEGISDSARTVLNQIIDAGRYQILSGKSGFFNKRSGLKKGDLEFELGTLKGVDINSDDIRKAIYLFDFPGPSNVLFDVLGLLENYGTKVTTVTDSMQGQMPSSDTPASLGLATIEQGMKVFSIIHKRIHRSFHKELKKIYILNGIHTKVEKYYKLIGEEQLKWYAQNGIVVNPISDYTGMMDVMPVSDPNIMSRTEQVAIAEKILTLTMQDPSTANNPKAVFEAKKAYLKALGKEESEIMMLNPPPPPPPDLSAVEENALALKEQMVQPLEHHDHLGHIIAHRAFQESPIALEFLTANGKNLIDRHLQEHAAMQYTLENQKVMQMQQQEDQMRHQQEQQKGGQSV